MFTKNVAERASRRSPNSVKKGSGLVLQFAQNESRPLFYAIGGPPRGSATFFVNITARLHGSLRETTFLRVRVTSTSRSATGNSGKAARRWSRGLARRRVELARSASAVNASYRLTGRVDRDCRRSAPSNRRVSCLSRMSGRPESTRASSGCAGSRVFRASSRDDG